MAANIEYGFPRFEGETDKEYYARLDAALSGDDFDEEVADLDCDDFEDLYVDDTFEDEWDWSDNDTFLDDLEACA